MPLHRGKQLRLSRLRMCPGYVDVQWAICGPGSVSQGQVWKFHPLLGPKPQTEQHTQPVQCYIIHRCTTIVLSTSISSSRASPSLTTTARSAYRNEDEQAEKEDVVVRVAVHGRIWIRLCFCCCMATIPTTAGTRVNRLTSESSTRCQCLPTMARRWCRLESTRQCLRARQSLWELSLLRLCWAPESPWTAVNLRTCSRICIDLRLKPLCWLTSSENRAHVVTARASDR